MSVRVVRLKNGEDVICDLFEVTMKDDPEKAVALRMDYPYNISILEPDDSDDIMMGFEEEGDEVSEEELTEMAEYDDALAEEEYDEGIKKMTGLDIDMRPWAPLCATNQILIKLDDIISAYETHEITVEKYNELVEAAKSGRRDQNSSLKTEK